MRERALQKEKAEYMKNYYASRPGYNAWKMHCRHLKKRGLPLPTFKQYTKWKEKAPKDSMGRVLSTFSRKYIQKLEDKAQTT